MTRESYRKKGKEGKSGGKKEAPVAKGGFRYGGYRCYAEGTGREHLQELCYSSLGKCVPQSLEDAVRSPHEMRRSPLRGSGSCS